MADAEQQPSRRYLLTLSLAALGVVYGDIGTSPLYAMKECFALHHGRRLPVTPENVLGILSLITWSLVLVISIKYLLFVLRADNRGEGGTLALMSLVRPLHAGRRGVPRSVLLALGLFGTALLYGDGMITPAITMLSAIEGVAVVAPVLEPAIVPMTVVALIVLFWIQKHGTARMGSMFGPLMTIWFSTLAILGIYNIVQLPGVLAAANPFHAIWFLTHHGVTGYLILGAVFLVVTGGESLYADMGHFGAKPIRLAWFYAVFPALLLNYFGQGSLLLRHPKASSDPFFLMSPGWARWPLVILATLAAAVASQAVISGAYSLTRQAVQLGYLPRMRIRHTSAREIGQIYIPAVNWMLAICAIGLVIGFAESTRLVSAYGIAVSTTMTTTTILYTVIAREHFRWRMPAVLAFLVPFLIIDGSFFGANIVKLADGGWFPILVGIVIFTVMTTWFTGRRILTSRLAESGINTDAFIAELAAGRIHRVRGTAIFMTRHQEGIPTALLHNIKHNKVVHERVVLLSVMTEEEPHLSSEERFEWVELGQGIYRLFIRFGFMEDPDLPETLRTISGPVSFDPMTTSYFLGRETLIPTKDPGMAIWREHLFAMMNRNATGAASFFSLPPNQVIELGAQVTM